MSSSGRIYKETLIHPSDHCVGTVKMVEGLPDKKQMKRVEKRIAKWREQGRGAVIKTWRTENSLEIYLSDRVS
ncbi:hypothetical protein KBC80_02480 [Candidatus Woesebacteria bacterium]|nr:hypothetical protein [Candidatus Woesebacteria bacterium]